MARISGLISGLDTDALIQELVSAYDQKKQQYVKKQTKHGWMQETWKGLNTKVYGFYTGTLRNAQYSSTYNAKKATISDGTKATVSASGNAVVGTQTLQVKQLAKTAYLTGGKVAGNGGKKLSANSKLGDFSGFSEGRIKVNVNGAEKEISLSSDMTVNQFVTKLKDAGLNANFDDTNQRFFVSGKSSGADNEFSITAADAGGMNALNSLGMDAASSSDVMSYINSATMDVQRNTDTAYAKYMLNLANQDLNTQLTGLKDQYRYVTDADYKAKKEESWQKSIEDYTSKNKALEDKNTEILAYTGADASDGSASPAISEFVEKQSDGTYAYKAIYLKDSVDADGNPVKDADGNTVKELDEDALTKALADQGAKFSTADVKEKLTELNKNAAQLQSNNAQIQSIEDTRTLYQNKAAADPDGSSLDTEIKNIEAEIAENKKLMEGTYDFTKDNLGAVTYKDENGQDQTVDLKSKLEAYAGKYVSSTETPGDASTGGKLNVISSVYDNYKKAYADEQSAALTKLGKTADELNAMTDEQKAEFAKEFAAANQSASGAVRVEGSDSLIILNGAEFTSNTNNFSINGLTITATGVTKDGEEVTINTATDIDGMYDSIKKMISGYNEILKEMNTLYYADSSKGYEPLTDDEKEAMSDAEVEKWEKKIKDSLLRRDDTLGGIMSAVKNSMAKSYTIGGKAYSLSSFGIGTAGYFAVDNEEQGLYHINGDPDDSTASGKEDKLKAALASDPDTVVQFFQELSKDMYNTLTKKMARTSLKSSYTLYNDKQMQKQYSEYGDKIDEWDEKIEKYTEKYVKQFTAMETAMSKLQASTSQLSNILG